MIRPQQRGKWPKIFFASSSVGLLSNVTGQESIITEFRFKPPTIPAGGSRSPCAIPNSPTEHILGPGYDEDQDGYDLLKPVYDYLARYPLTANHLAAVTSIDFDGGNEIYTYPFPFWSGETDEFEVASLDGIERLINLRRIEIISLLTDLDLSRLATLKQLEHVGLDLGQYQNGEALLQLPALKTLTCSTLALSDPSVIPALRARGVAVRIIG